MFILLPLIADRLLLLLSGSVFSNEIQLGGVLHSTKLTSAIAASTLHEKMDKLKIAAGVSFSTPFGSGSGSFEKGQGSDSSNASASSSKRESLTWSAKGGDALLCSK